MVSLNIREVADADWPRIGALCTLLVEQHYAYDRARFIPVERLPADVFIALVRKEIAEERAAVFVADVDGQVMGYAFATVKAESWKALAHEAGYVHDLVIDPAAQRRGLGAALLERAVRWIEAQGVSQIMLWTAMPNKTAHALFKRAGFRPTMMEITHDLA